jgi:hypothetical protein
MEVAVGEGKETGGDRSERPRTAGSAELKTAVSRDFVQERPLASDNVRLADG